MALFPDEFVRAVLERASIEEVIASKGIQLKRVGRELKACCPLHKENTPSFTVVPEKQFFKCFGCHKGGDAAKFLMEHDGLSFREAIEDLAQRVGMDLPQSEDVDHAALQRERRIFDALERATAYYQDRLRHAPDVLDYLHDRGLTDETIANYRIGFVGLESVRLVEALGVSQEVAMDAGLIRQSTSSGKIYDTMRARIIFPIADARGRTLGFGGRIWGDNPGKLPKYINSPETSVYVKSRQVFGLKQALPSDNIAILEGYVDAIVLNQGGFASVSSCGTAVTEDHMRLVMRHARTIFIGMDPDSAGVKATRSALLKTLPVLRGNRTMRVIEWGAPLDPDEFLNQRGVEAVRERFDQARYASDFLVGTLGSSAEERALAIEELTSVVESMQDGPFKQLFEDKIAEIAGRRPAGGPERPSFDTPPEQVLLAMVLQIVDARSAAWLDARYLSPRAAQVVKALRHSTWSAERVLEQAPDNLAGWLAELMRFDVAGASLADVEKAYLRAAMQECIKRIAASGVSEELVALSKMKLREQQMEEAIQLLSAEAKAAPDSAV